jgi:hypothetical protein
VRETDLSRLSYPREVEVFKIMQAIGWIKRVLPFVATFAIGVFIASFFVDVGASRDRCRKGRKFQEMHRLRAENEELRNENLRLRNQMEIDVERLMPSHEWEGTALDGLPHPLPVAPPPPPMSKAAK